VPSSDHPGTTGAADASRRDGTLPVAQNVKGSSSANRHVRIGVAGSDAPFPSVACCPENCSRAAAAAQPAGIARRFRRGHEICV